MIDQSDILEVAIGRRWEQPARLIGLIRRPFRPLARARAYRAASHGKNWMAVLYRYVRRAGRGKPALCWGDRTVCYARRMRHGPHSGPLFN